MDTVTLVREAVMDNPKLKKIIVETNLADQEQEQLIQIAIEDKAISDLPNNRLLITSKINQESQNSSEIRDVNSAIKDNNCLLTTNQEIYGTSHRNLIKEKPDEQLKYLVIQACGHSCGSQERQKLLTQIIRLASKKLWRESTPYYQDAVQQTWLYFCRNVCEGLTGQTYDPTYGSVINWLNAYLKHRLQDFYIDQYREKATTHSLRRYQSTSGDRNETIDPIDNLPASPQAPPILENLQIWVKTDFDGELRHTYIKGRPDVNCQVLILKRLPPEVSWKQLSEEFGLPIPTLSSFYQRQCLPRLRSFAELEGLL